jgi:DNA-binding NtrC family response regulator
MSGTLLVIDDEAAIRDSFRRRLTAEGYTVLEAGSGLKAVERVERDHVDLVITDILMPGQEGIETIRSLHQRFPRLPIIAISGSPHYYYLSAAQRLGATRTFQKPFDLDDLVRAVREELTAVSAEPSQ